MLSRRILLTIAVMAVLTVLPSAALAASYSVPGDYPNISMAIANASAGDTINVDSGTYHENLLIDKELTIIGREAGIGMPTIEVTSGTGIEVAADNVILQRLRIKGASTGVRVKDCGNARVMECILLDNGDGVMVTGAHGCSVMNNTVTGNRNAGIHVSDSNGCAIYLNYVTGNQYGISLTGTSASNTVYMNALKDNAGANGLGNGIWNHWNSSMTLSYGYGGRQFSGYLGNYWGNLGGSDANGDGVLDTEVMLAENNGDHAPLVEPVPERPAANFTSDGTSGIAPLPVQFTDASGGYPVSWLWDFGDGASSNVQSPPHIYKEPGPYTVSLTVKNVRGESKLVRSGYIVAGTVPSPTPLPTSAPSLTPTPEPWPTSTPTAKPTGTATAAAPPTPKPTPGMGLFIGIIALAIACPAILKTKGR